MNLVPRLAMQHECLEIEKLGSKGLNNLLLEKRKLLATETDVLVAGVSPFASVLVVRGDGRGD